MKVWLLACVTLTLPASHALGGQETAEWSFPLIPTGEIGALGAFELVPVVPEILELRGAADVLEMTEVSLPSDSVSLSLRRIPIRGGTRVHVNGALQLGPADAGDLSIWKGVVRGHPGSDVLLGFSAHGCHGWIDDGETRWNLLSSAGAGGDWSSFTSRWVSDEAIVAIGPELGPTCALDTSGRSPVLVDELSSTSQSLASSVTTLECPIAIETDYQLYLVFGSLPAMQNYVTLLITAVSERMLEQADVILTYPYIGYYTNANDPWTSQDNGGGCGDVLNEFRAAWTGNTPAGAALGHFISGAWLGCGVAWVGTVCNPDWGFSLSCCINGGVGYPVTQGSNTWDFYVMAHEIGHNMGSGHTHDSYCPPLDECADNCNGSTQCTNQGTNLSYCHGCPGGMVNITTYYHPTVAGVMRAHAESSCIESWCTDAETYCSTTPNSASAMGAEIYWNGSTSIQKVDFSLGVFGAIPGGLGLFFYGAAQTNVPFGDGLRCVAGGGVPIQRLGPPKAADSLGSLERPINFLVAPAGVGAGQIHPASTWNFQYWFRDPQGGQAGFNLSNALSVTFCP